MAALCLHNDIHILPGRKTGAECNGERCHIAGGAEVLLGQNGIHQDFRLCLPDAAARRVDQNGHGVLCPDSGCLLQGVDADGPQTFHGGFSFVYGLAQRNLPPDRCRVGGLQHEHPQPGGP
jgi:hypothetical protein